MSDFSDYSYSYKARHVPGGLSRELREAADQLGMPIKVAFGHLVAPTGEPDVAYLRETMIRGQQRVAEWSEDDTELLSVHLPADFRAALTQAARRLSVHVSAAGKLVLMAHGGEMRQVLTDANDAQAEPETETAAAV